MWILMGRAMFEGRMPSLRIMVGEFLFEGGMASFPALVETVKERIPCPISIIRQTKSRHAVNLYT